ncbi:hypothetical protein Tco_1577968 [Tanacetum coccineum]
MVSFLFHYGTADLFSFLSTPFIESKPRLKLKLSTIQPSTKPGRDVLEKLSIVCPAGARLLIFHGDVGEQQWSRVPIETSSRSVGEDGGRWAILTTMDTQCYTTTRGMRGEAQDTRLSARRYRASGDVRVEDVSSQVKFWLRRDKQPQRTMCVRVVEECGTYGLHSWTSRRVSRRTHTDYGEIVAEVHSGISAESDYSHERKLLGVLYMEETTRGEGGTGELEEKGDIVEMRAVYLYAGE